jgi:hypothetical protein
MSSERKSKYYFDDTSESIIIASIVAIKSDYIVPNGEMNNPLVVFAQRITIEDPFVKP